MTGKERVLKAINFEETDIVPYNIMFEEDAQRRVEGYFGSLDFIKSHFDMFFPNLFAVEYEDGTYLDYFGNKWVKGSTDRVIDSVLKEPSLKGLDFPELMNEDNMERLEKWLENGCDGFKVVTMAYILFEKSWQLRGFENILVDFITEPAFIEELYERLADYAIDAIEKICHYPFDAIIFTDDLAQQRGLIMSPEHWHRYLMPSWKRIFAKAREKGKYVIFHCCGEVTPIIPDLIDIGMQMLNPLQPESMDIAWIKKEYGKIIAFNGGIGSQRILPFGTPDEVREEIRYCRNVLGTGGGYVIEAGKPVRNETPTENLIAFVEEMTNPA